MSGVHNRMQRTALRAAADTERSTIQKKEGIDHARYQNERESNGAR
jgi:hypothetical protein